MTPNQLSNSFSLISTLRMRHELYSRSVELSGWSKGSFMYLTQQQLLLIFLAKTCTDVNQEI